jgi:hypothetical protein
MVSFISFHRNVVACGSAMYVSSPLFMCYWFPFFNDFQKRILKKGQMGKGNVSRLLDSLN